MLAKGYPKDYTASVLAIGGTLGPVIPPSTIFIFYAMATNVSVVKLFISGVGPGLLSCLGLSTVALIMAKKSGMPKGEMPNLKTIFSSVRHAAFALLMPVIILGGIYRGFLQPQNRRQLR